VDASWYTNAVARTSKLTFAHAPVVTVIPPNALPPLVSRFERFTVIGSGKTGIDEEKNALATPLPGTVCDFIISLWPDMMNRYACSKHPKVRAWVNQSRLDGYSKIASAVAPDDETRRAILEDVKTASMAAAGNMGRLMEALG